MKPWSAADSSQATVTNALTFMLAMVASLSGILFGYDASSINAGAVAFLLAIPQ